MQTILHPLNLCQKFFMIVLASNTKKMKFENFDPEPEALIKP